MIAGILIGAVGTLLLIAVATVAFLEWAVRQEERLWNEEREKLRKAYDKLEVT